MYSKILFLDIDGVLLHRISEKYIRDEINKYIDKNYKYDMDITIDHEYIAEASLFSKDAINNIDSLLKYFPDIKIVLTSNWRFMGDINYIKYIFSKYYFSNFIIDKTISMRNRGLEIREWLRNNLTEKYVIFDDNDDQISTYHLENFIKVFMIKEDDIDKAIKITFVNRVQRIKQTIPTLVPYS